MAEIEEIWAEIQAVKNEQAAIRARITSKLVFKPRPKPQRSVLAKPVSHLGQNYGFAYQKLAHLRKFQNFCRPTIDGKVRSMAEILDANRKNQAAKFKAFCHPKGILSVLKDPYWTGRLITEHDGGQGFVEELRLKKIGNEFISEDPQEGILVVSQAEAMALFINPREENDECKTTDQPED